MVIDDRGGAYQPSTEGSRFLVLLPVGAPVAPPLTVVANWQVAYHVKK